MKKSSILSNVFSQIRNFSIIAHIDHGKSTLADRLLEKTGLLRVQEIGQQFLDRMELERERGITIKAKTVRMEWKNHILNLLDTPGHVDFTFEVHRALWACEGVLLVVDASQGVQAQTVANYEIAKKAGLVIIPVINKIDLSNAQVEETENQLLEILNVDTFPLRVSAKVGLGIDELLDHIVSAIPPPRAPENDFAALIFDSYFDNFQGVVLLIRVVDGAVAVGQQIRFMNVDRARPFVVEEIGYLAPDRKPIEKLEGGEVGYLLCGLKDPREVIHGSTLVSLQTTRLKPLRELGDPLKPFVFVGIYPIQVGDVDNLGRAFEKLHLTDPSLTYTPEGSSALGPGFRCGFLGMLHLDIIQQRLKREFSQEIIVTNPNVLYRVHLKKGSVVDVANPALFAHYSDITAVEEPYAKVTILTPLEFVGGVSELLKSKRGEHQQARHLTPTRLELIWNVPLSEIVVDFFDKLKSISKGYASMDYELCGYHCKDQLVKLEILIQGEPCDSLASICPKDRSYEQGRQVLEKLRQIIPRQLFEVTLQAAYEGKIIAKERIASLRKDVLAKCYGGDISRKMKLLAKQKEGKKKMRMIGKVEVPPEAFLTVLRK